MNIGINKVKDKIKIFKSLFIIDESSFLGKKPPPDIVVKAKLNESKNLKSTKVYKNIIIRVETE